MWTNERWASIINPVGPRSEQPLLRDTEDCPRRGVGRNSRGPVLPARLLRCGIRGRFPTGPSSPRRTSRRTLRSSLQQLSTRSHSGLGVRFPPGRMDCRSIHAHRPLYLSSSVGRNPFRCRRRNHSFCSAPLGLLNQSHSCYQDYWCFSTKYRSL